MRFATLMAKMRGRDAPLTPKAQVAWGLILGGIILGCALMIFFAARG